MEDIVDPSFDTRHLGFNQLKANNQNIKQDIVAFDNPAAYSRSIRATALVFEDPLSKEIYERLQTKYQGRR